MHPFQCARAFTRCLFGQHPFKAQASASIHASIDDTATSFASQSTPVSESVYPESSSSNGTVLSQIDLEVGVRLESPLKPSKTLFRRFLDLFGHSKHNLPVTPECPEVSQEDGDHGDEDDETDDGEGEEDGEYSDDGEPDEENEDDRRNFKHIRALMRQELEDFVLKTLYPGPEPNFRTCSVQKRKEGSFHHVAFIHVNNGEELEQQYVLKIPAHGIPGRWKLGDDFMLRSEAILMQHIRHYTQCPVPEVVAFCSDTHNALQAPFILMKEIHGTSALDFWFGKPLKEVNEGEAYLEADNPSPELEQKRIRFLTSLAQAMSHLQGIRFERVGMPVFHQPEDEKPFHIGPVFKWHSTAQMQPLEGIGPFPSASYYWQRGLNDAWSMSETKGLDPNTFGVQEFVGVRKILSMIRFTEPLLYKHPPPQVTTDNNHQPTALKDKFVLRHNDLNLQNILVDDDGNVTGIIDWDSCHAVPSCVGYASLPLFLRGDWLGDNTMARCPYMTWGFDHYRTAYADAMKEACQTSDGLLSDARYTKKSDMYQAILDVFYDGEDARQVIGKILAEIEDFRRVDVRHFCARLGKGWPAAEEVLKEKLTELFAPKM